MYLENGGRLELDDGPNNTYLMVIDYPGQGNITAELTLLDWTNIVQCVVEINLARIKARHENEERGAPTNPQEALT